ncbi:MAG: hypothetical protein EXS36_16275 [Pedosphaera sp.]|nr:hypothetical protein [Pedosphaera sp.]
MFSRFLAIRRRFCCALANVIMVSVIAAADAAARLAATPTPPTVSPRAGPPPKLVLPGEQFTVIGRPAFVFLPPPEKRSMPQPWIFYAPTLAAYPDEAERWMHEQFLAAGIAVAGVDVGEAYGSPKSHTAINGLYTELTSNRGFAAKPCLFGRSRGGLWVSSWAIANPGRVAGIIGIYPVFDFKTYPGITNAAPAYDLSPSQLAERAEALNPISRVDVLAKARIPVTLIHGDVDTVVPLQKNSAELLRQYKDAGSESLVKLIVLKGQGHSFYPGFFQSRDLVDFAVGRARAGAASSYFPPPDDSGGWRTLTDAVSIRNMAGMDVSKLDQAFEVAQRGTQNGGLLVLRHGYLVYERYFGRAHRNANPDMASTGKAYTSIACGIMLSEFRDKIPKGLDTRVFTKEFLPQALPLDDPRKADISLGQLLCMTAGYWGEGGAPTAVVEGRALSLKPVPGQNVRDLDMSSLRVPLWTNAGAGYSYSSPAPHIASIVLRGITGMGLQEYIQERLGRPMGWGAWNYCLYRGDFTLPHANGAGSIAVHATDALRFGYCLLREGKWGNHQLVPADYIAQCNRFSPYNNHTPFTLQFEHNADGHVPGAPRDAFYKSSAGGFGLFIIPSLDLVLYKLGGSQGQYDPALTRIPQPPDVDVSRDNWKPAPRTPFQEGSLGGDDGLRRVLELIAAAVRE